MRNRRLNYRAISMALFAIVGASSVACSAQDNTPRPANVAFRGGQGGFITLPDTTPAPTTYALSGDVGDLSQAQAVVIVSHVVALVIAPPGSSIDGIDKLKGRTIGVIGEETNSKLVDVLSNEYGLVRGKVFKDVALADARHALPPGRARAGRFRPGWPSPV